MAINKVKNVIFRACHAARKCGALVDIFACYTPTAAITALCLSVQPSTYSFWGSKVAVDKFIPEVLATTKGDLGSLPQSRQCLGP